MRSTLACVLSVHVTGVSALAAASARAWSISPASVSHAALARRTLVATPPPSAARAVAPAMEEAPFWDNMQRYATFAVTSMSGLVLGLLQPIFSLFGRTRLTQGIGVSLLIGVLAFFYATLQAMQLPVEMVQDTADVPMNEMMLDLYGR